jgi:membrane protease YdiL (CAAX protease family)
MEIEPPVRGTKAWGRWTALGLGLVAALVAQVPALMAYSWWFGLDVAHWADLPHSGVAVIVLVCVSTPVQIALLAFFARRAGVTATNYLGLTVPRGRDFALALVAAMVVIAVGDGINKLRGDDIVTPFQLDIYRTASAAGWLPWLWITVVMMAPIGEETLFRGFLFRSWNRSPRDAWTAIAMTALLWTAVHVQYELYVMGQVFVIGLAFGWVRWKTGSTLPTILMHCLLNGAGMLETFMALRA